MICVYMGIYIYMLYTSTQSAEIPSRRTPRYPLVFAAAVRFEDGEVAVASEPWRQSWMTHVVPGNLWTFGSV